MWKCFGSGKPQQSAAAARALQAGGRPFEPGTAHPRGPLLEAGASGALGPGAAAWQGEGSAIAAYE